MANLAKANPLFVIFGIFILTASWLIPETHTIIHSAVPTTDSDMDDVIQEEEILEPSPTYLRQIIDGFGIGGSDPNEVTNEVVHEAKVSDTPPPTYIRQFSDGLGLADNKHPAMQHEVVEQIDLSKPKWNVKIMGTIIGILSFLVPLHSGIIKLKSKYMDTVLNYLRPNSFS